MLDYLGEAHAAALVGLIGGVLLGLAARVGRFCTLGAVEDCLYGSDDRRLRMWGVAIAVAIIGTHAALALDLLEAKETAYLGLTWSPVGVVIGGLMFGYGMALSGNCGYGALARLGGGDLRAFVIVMVMGISAYIVMSGPLASGRVWLFSAPEIASPPQGIGQWLELRAGVSPALTGFAIGGALLVLSLGNRRMRRSPRHILWGAVVGFAVCSGWIGAQWIASNGFSAAPVETHRFAAPLGETILYAMTASGNTLSFSVGSVVGVVLGAFIGSRGAGHFRWEACEDPRELKRQILGAALMGPGAVLAGGCSIGQGIAAFSVLAFSAPLVLAAILLGAAIGLRQLISGFAPAE